MADSKIISIFRTNKIPTTHISQNHLDALHTAINNFCELNKEYEWCCIAKNNKIINYKPIEYIKKHEPRTLRYLIKSKTYERELMITIDNGITINLKNGSYMLYGFYSLINDTVDHVKVPSYIVYLRRYWLLNTLFAGWFIPLLFLLVFGNPDGALFWFIIFPFGLLTLIGSILNEKDNFIENLEWDDVVLSTKIQYRTYHQKVGSPILSLLSSTKTIISITASIATIFSFIFYVIQR